VAVGRGRVEGVGVRCQLSRPEHPLMYDPPRIDIRLFSRLEAGRAGGGGRRGWRDGGEGLGTVESPTLSDA